MPHPLQLVLGLSTCALLACASAASGSRAAGATFDSPALRARFDELARASGAPGVSACVVRADGASIELVRGWADREAAKPMEARTRMLAGSVGKTFFGALALQLVREGRLDLDAPIERYLGDRPWFARLPNARAIRVRMLLQHRSGLVRYEFDPRFAAELARDPLREWKPEEELAYVFDRPAPFAAGEGWEYSDTNFVVLGLILEALTKTACYAEIEQRFLRPLALERTLPSTSPRIADLAQGYAASDDPITALGVPGGRMLERGALVFNPQFEWAGGGFASSPRDLARWNRAVQTGEIFGAELLSRARESVPAPLLGPHAGYGLGMIRWQTPLGVAYGHAGYFPGYLTEVRWFEDSRTCVAVMLNTSDAKELTTSAGALCVELARAALEAR